MNIYKLITPNSKYVIYTHVDVQREKDIKASLAVVNEAWVENVYQIERKHFHDTGIFIDLGANVGATSLYVHSLGQDSKEPVIKIYAYEPEPMNFKFLQKNIKQNNASSIIPIRKAIWCKDEIEITVSGSGSTYQKKDNEKTVKVKAVTLKKIFSDNKIEGCDVLKMDIERAEWEVFKETDIDTLMRIKYLTMEFHSIDDKTFGEVITKLAEVYNLHIIGKPSRGGQIYGNRY